MQTRETRYAAKIYNRAIAVVYQQVPYGCSPDGVATHEARKELVGYDRGPAYRGATDNVQYFGLTYADCARL